LNGGKHAEKSTDFQEFMIVPHGFKKFSEALEAGTNVFHALKKILHDRGFGTTVGDEGGFAPKLKSNEEALLLIETAIKESLYTFDQIKIGMDVAASSFFENGIYKIKIDGKERELNYWEMISWYESLIKKHPIISIEDGLAEDDWQGWKSLKKALPSTQLVGDDLLVTNTSRLQYAIEEDAANAILIKPNQIGTLTETINAIKMAKENGWKTIISHRSGETEDVSIVHLAIGTNAGQIKTGSLSRSERVAKYNELLRLEQIDPSLKLAQIF